MMVDVSKARELLDAATAIPWEINTEGWACVSSGPDSVFHAYIEAEATDDGFDYEAQVASSLENLELIVFAVNNLGDLLTALQVANAETAAWRLEADRLEAENAKLRALRTEDLKYCERLTVENERLRAERDDLASRVIATADALGPVDGAMVGGRGVVITAKAAIGELLELRGQVERVEALRDKWSYKGEFGWGPWQAGGGPDETGHALDHVAGEIRAALRGDGA